MKTKAVIGWLVLIGISLLPAVCLILFGYEINEFVGYASITHTFGELTGLVAMTMMALTFVLSTRWKFIENVFNGLDKVYIAHGVLGGTALTLILLHPILLVLKFIPSNFKQAAIYLLPSNSWSVNFGIIALIGMIFLIYITLFTRMKYNRWKFTHEFLGVVFIFAVLHIFLVPGDVAQDGIFRGYYIYAILVSLIGLGGFSYSLFLKNRFAKAAVYTIQKIVKKGRTHEISLIAEHKPISYKAGQFIFLRFYNKSLGKEPHPFSIASSSNNPSLKVIIKELGDFTAKLIHLKIGDKVSVEGPYGRFNYHDGKKDQVWLAGGIGITPFIGMAGDLAKKIRFNHKVDLYYSARDENEFIGLQELKDFEANNNKFTLIPWTTESKGYIDANVISKHSGDILEKEFYLCGPNSFKHGITKSLIKFGVSKRDIHTEEFDFK